LTMKKKILAFVVILVLTTLTNFLVHAVLLQGVYQQNANLMRPPQDQSHAPFLLVGFFFFALAFVWLYPNRTTGGQWPIHGLRYGVAVWLLAAVSRYFIYYAIQPWPINTVLLQIAYEFVMMLILGEALAFVASR